MIGIVITEMRSLTTSDTNTGNFETLPCILWNFIDIYNKYIIILNSCLFLSYIEAPFCAYIRYALWKWFDFSCSASPKDGRYFCAKLKTNYAIRTARTSKTSKRTSAIFPIRRIDCDASRRPDICSTECALLSDAIVQVFSLCIVIRRYACMQFKCFRCALLPDAMCVKVRNEDAQKSS